MIKNILLLTLLTTLLFSNSVGQTNIANELYDNYEFRNAIIYYEKAQPLKEIELRKLAECYFYMHDYNGAEKTYRNIIEKGQIKPLDYLKFGEALKNNKHYGEAKKYFYKYQESFPEDDYVADLIKGTGYLERKGNAPERFELLWN